MEYDELLPVIFLWMYKRPPFTLKEILASFGEKERAVITKIITALLENNLLIRYANGCIMLKN